MLIWEITTVMEDCSMCYRSPCGTCSPSRCCGLHKPRSVLQAVSRFPHTTCVGK